MSVCLPVHILRGPNWKKRIEANFPQHCFAVAFAGAKECLGWGMSARLGDDSSRFMAFSLIGINLRIAENSISYDF